MNERKNYTPGQEAHEVSHTRFGPRPPIGQPSTGAPRLQSRRIPPSGDVSPKGDRAWPKPSLTSQVVVYGGCALMAAAATAGVVLAARKVADMVSGSDDDDRARPQRPRSAPRFVDLDDNEREYMRRRVREQSRADSDQAARLRANAARNRFGPRPNVGQSVRQTADQISGSLTGLLSALAGFRGVAQQAGGIIREFSDAADVVRSVLDRNEDRHGQTHAARRPVPREDDRRTHKL